MNVFSHSLNMKKMNFYSKIMDTQMDTLISYCILPTYREELQIF